jgi:hypothetical protein
MKKLQFFYSIIITLLFALSVKISAEGTAPSSGDGTSGNPYQIATLVNKELAPGNYSVEFNATILASGIYFYRLSAGSFTETKK